MQISIYIKALFFLLIFAFFGYAENKIFEYPEEIHELENVMIVINKPATFYLTINNKCLTVSQTNGITVKNGKYVASGSSSYLELENKCFEGDEVTIKVKSNDKNIEKKYKILPPIKEERDWGC